MGPWHLVFACRQVGSSELPPGTPQLFMCLETCSPWGGGDSLPPFPTLPLLLYLPSLLTSSPPPSRMYPVLTLVVKLPCIDFKKTRLQQLFLLTLHVCKPHQAPVPSPLHHAQWLKAWRLGEGSSLHCLFEEVTSLANCFDLLSDWKGNGAGP